MRENVSAESFSAVDDHVIVTASAATDSEILSQILDDNDDSDDEIVIEDKPPVRPSKMETENTLETLQNAFLYAIKYGFEMLNLVLQLDKLMDTERKSNSQQKLVRNYFKIVQLFVKWCVLTNKKLKNNNFLCIKISCSVISRYFKQFSDPLKVRDVKSQLYLDQIW